MDENDIAAGKRLYLWLVVLFCIGGAVAWYFVNEAEADKYEQPQMPCIYDPRTGEPVTTPCAK